MRGRAGAVLALCWLAACDNGGRQDVQHGPETQSVQTPANDENAEGGMPVQPIPRPEQTMAAGVLSPVNNSGVGGSVTLRGIGEQTEVLLNVTELADGVQRVDAAIVQGTCEQSGAEVAQIGPIPVGAGSVAAVTDTVPLPPGTVLNGQHALVVKSGVAGPATPPLACAALPDWQRLPPSA